MKREHLFLIFILLLALISFYLLYEILLPFLPSIAWAVLLAMIFYPLFLRVRRLLKGRATLCALAMTVFIVIVWFPAVIILIAQGAVAKGFALLGFGVLGISMVDNFLRPLLISSRTRIHPFLLFFTVLGGVQVFGLIGLVAGPLVATVCLTLVEIYREGFLKGSEPR